MPLTTTAQEHARVPRQPTTGPPAPRTEGR